MANKNTLDKVRARIERLRKDSLATATEANKIVSKGVQQIADSELKALNDTYKATIKQLQKAARGKGSTKDKVTEQIDVLQDTANRVIATAREAVGVMSETRQELMKLMRQNSIDTKAAMKQAQAATAQARAAVSKAGTTARKAAEKATKKVSKSTTKKAKKATSSARKTARKATKTAKKATKNTASAGKKATKRARTAAQSRAGAATSRAKRAARKTPSATKK